MLSGAITALIRSDGYLLTIFTFSKSHYTYNTSTIYNHIRTLLNVVRCLHEIFYSIQTFGVLPAVQTRLFQQVMSPITIRRRPI